MAEVRKKKTSGTAIASLVFGFFSTPLLYILSFFVYDVLKKILGKAPYLLVAFSYPFSLFSSLLAITLGINALLKISKNTETLKGKPFAIAGIILGSLTIAFTIFIIVMQFMGYDA